MSHKYTILECESVLEDDKSTLEPFPVLVNNFPTNDSCSKHRFTTIICLPAEKSVYSYMEYICVSLQSNINVHAFFAVFHSVRNFASWVYEIVT